LYQKCYFEKLCLSALEYTIIHTENIYLGIADISIKKEWELGHTISLVCKETQFKESIKKLTATEKRPVVLCAESYKISVWKGLSVNTISLSVDLSSCVTLFKGSFCAWALCRSWKTLLYMVSSKKIQQGSE
jgi:hypothetical protein